MAAQQRMRAKLTPQFGDYRRKLIKDFVMPYLAGRLPVDLSDPAEIEHGERGTRKNVTNKRA